MRPSTATLVHHTQNIDSEIHMQVDQNSLAHIMSVLTDLYSDRKKAVIREYLTNALDSHIEAGTSDPVLVQAPSDVSPNFVVQDFGVGLSPQEIREVYSMYGRSTKRNSDDVAGMLGLGCKSGLTYANSFNVTGIKNGTKTEAVVTKDEKGIGVIKILDISPTEDRDGVKIVVPVPRYDHESFSKKIRNFLSYWEPGSVKILDEDINFVRDQKEENLWLDDDVCLTPGRGYSRIVMGGVAYPFSPNLVYSENFSITAWVDMGSVDFTPSREELQHTDKTDELIRELVEYCRKMKPVAVERIVKAKGLTLFDQAKLLDSWSGYSKSHGAASWDPEKVGYGFSLGVEEYNDRAIKRDSVSYGNLLSESLEIVINYPHKAVKREHKDVLPGRCLILPKGLPLDFLDGRPNVKSWETTYQPEVQKPAKTSGTTYTVCQAGESQKSTDRVVLAPGEKLVYLGLNDTHDLGLCPEVKYVCLGLNRIDKFKRLHPEAIPYPEFIAQKRKELKESLTLDQKIYMVAHRTLWTKMGLAYEKIKDPDLFRIYHVLATKPEIPRVVSKLVDASEFRPLVDQVFARYPLIDRASMSEEMILYCNLKYDYLTSRVSGKENS